MSKLKKVLEFIFALLNFLFHFKTTADEELPDIMVPVPEGCLPNAQTRDEPLFETIP